MKTKFSYTALAFFLLTSLVFAQGDGKKIKAADFTLSGVDGKPVTLSDYKGKVVILDFWATWCPPCRDEIPHFNALYKEYKDKGLIILGISLDRGGKNDIMKFLEDNTIDYRIANVFVEDENGQFYPDESGSTAMNTYQSYLPEDMRGGIPFTFVIDKEGFIREKYVGYRDKEVFEKAIKPLLIEE